VKGENGPQFPFEGDRGYGIGTFNSLTPQWLKMSQNAAHRDSGACYGDSGGPDLPRRRPGRRRRRSRGDDHGRYPLLLDQRGWPHRLAVGAGLSLDLRPVIVTGRSRVGSAPIQCEPRSAGQRQLRPLARVTGQAGKPITPQSGPTEGGTPQTGLAGERRSVATMFSLLRRWSVVGLEAPEKEEDRGCMPALPVLKGSIRAGSTT
jgi:hypothetical protein